MSWFWRINYLLSVYFAGVLGLLLFDAGHTSSRLHGAISLFTFNGSTGLMGFIVDWIQFPLCLLVYLFGKAQRNRLHSFYLIFLLVSALFKLLALLVLGSFLGDM